jgi:6-phosphogluconate dehydrogenase
MRAIKENRAALCARFSSRGSDEYTDGLLSAMGYEFGGHLEKAATGER